MKSGLILGVVVGILAILSILAGWYFYPQQAIYNQGFEENFGGWEEDSDVPPDPNNPGFPVEWNVSRVKAPVESGRIFCRIIP
jgi:hypothetical protein